MVIKNGIIATLILWLRNLFVLTTGTLLFATLISDFARSQDKEKDSVKITIEAEKKYLLGFPMIVAITIDVETDSKYSLSMPQLDLLIKHPPALSVELSPIPDGKPITVNSPPSSYAFESEAETERGPIHRKTFTVQPGESRRILFDIGPWFAKTSPGKYTLKAKLWGNGNSNHETVNSVEVEFVSPGKADNVAIQDALRTVSEEDHPNGWPLLLKRKVTMDTLSSKLSKETNKSLSLYYFLYSVFYSSDKIADIQLSGLDSLPQMLKPEAGVFQYEVLTAKGKQDEANKVKEEIIKSYPGIRWRFNAVDDGKGVLTTGRILVGTDKKR